MRCPFRRGTGFPRSDGCATTVGCGPAHAAGGPVDDVSELTARQLLARVRAGDLPVAAVAETVLELAAAREPVLHAFAALEPERVRARAAELDGLDRRAALHGLPVAVKDLVDTADLPTTYGSPIYAGHRPA